MNWVYDVVGVGATGKNVTNGAIEQLALVEHQVDSEEGKQSQNQHHVEHGQKSQSSSGVELSEVDPAGSPAFFEQQRGDEESTHYKEHVHAGGKAGKRLECGVGQDDEHHGNAAESVERREVAKLVGIRDELRRLVYGWLSA